MSRQPLKLQFLFLGGALALLAGLYPILAFGQIGLALWTLALIGVVLTTIPAAGSRPNRRRIARIMGGIALGASVTGYLCFQFLQGDHDWIYLAVNLATFAFFAFATGAILDEVLRTTTISINHLTGAAAAYVLLGLTFAYAFLVLQGFSTAPLLQGEGEVCAGAHFVANPRHADFLYYSFVTLTTLGFGDLTPATLGARLLTGLKQFSASFS